MPVQQIREAIRDAIREEMLRDDNVFLMGEEVGHYDGGTSAARACSRSSARSG